MSTPSFTIERRSDLNFKSPNLVCDKCIHTQIEPPLPSTAHAMLLRSDKTSMMVSLLQEELAYTKTFHQVFIAMPP